MLWLNDTQLRTFSRMKDLEKRIHSRQIRHKQPVLCIKNTKEVLIILFLLQKQLEDAIIISCNMYCMYLTEWSDLSYKQQSALHQITPAPSCMPWLSSWKNGHKSKVTFPPAVSGQRKATSCMPATSVHALPCACRWLAILGPTLQRPVSSTMALRRARRLFLLENSALKCDLSGVERRSKHDIFKSRYQLGEFHHLYNELRKDCTKFF